MNQELKNTEKRKAEPLTNKEWFTFFIIPVNPNSRLNSKSANQIEYERYERFGFKKKMEQADTARIAGVLFYFFIILIAIIIYYIKL
ncbi:hypothetical protein [Algibacter mikhailovii]|uniref:Uncharacterized protein n=1 Tax=Algibacter mikhailovii TaxID=425498 RepID=A0A918RFN9_9FLAO|nr:hypothetical protein [Algibacter mikhailovii]GGZ95017.1 hypothetical protein GCM10007028_36430 [Algibacter mikhailovii]